MKVVKLHRRYVLAQHGFTHALRFESRCQASDAIKKALGQMYIDIQPWTQWWRQQNQDAPWGIYKNPKNPGSPYWIGVKNPADLTAAVLMAQTVDV